MIGDLDGKRVLRTLYSPLQLCVSSLLRDVFDIDIDSFAANGRPKSYLLVESFRRINGVEWCNGHLGSFACLLEMSNFASFFSLCIIRIKYGE